jgi:hypothetical protein
MTSSSTSPANCTPEPPVSAAAALLGMVPRTPTGLLLQYTYCMYMHKMNIMDT